MSKPILAITMGDPTGVGPEVIVGAWATGQLHQHARPIVLGEPTVLARAAALWSTRHGAPPVRVEPIADSRDPVTVDSSPALLPCWSVCRPDAAQAPAGQVDARGGQAAYDALLAAIAMAQAGAVDAIVTAPLHKRALWEAGHRYPGHTELLAERCGAAEYAMMLYLAPEPPERAAVGVRGAAGLGVIHVTLHMSVREALARLSTAAVLEKIQLAHRALGAIKGAAPRLGVGALNPHAGEEGLFGDEESRLIRPAVAQAQRQGIDAAGPFPADTLMVRARDGEFDGVVAMLHDHGHIALKLLGMHRAVNVTLGLPLIRTSVAHGTAHEIAWQAQADPGSMIEAVRVAARLVASREQFVVLTQRRKEAGTQRDNSE